MKRLVLCSLFVLFAGLFETSEAAEDTGGVRYGKYDGQAQVDGVATPIDLNMQKFYVRTAGGNVEVKTHKDTIVGVQHYIRHPSKVLNHEGKLEFEIGRQIPGNLIVLTDYTVRRYRCYGTD